MKAPNKNQSADDTQGGQLPSHPPLLRKSLSWSFFSTSNGIHWLVLLIFTVGGCWLIQGEVDQTTNETTSYIKSLAHIEDVDNVWSPSEAIERRADFLPSDSHSYNFGLSKSGYWVLVTIEKPHQDVTELMLDIGYPHLDHLNIYLLEENEPSLLHIMGDTLPFSARPISDRSFVIPVNFSPEESTKEILLHTYSEGPIHLPLTISSVDQYHLSDREEQLILGFYYGILFGVLAYNLLLAIGTREAVYGYYCAYATFQISYQLSQNGLTYEYLWPWLPGWHQVSVLLFTALTMYFCTLFTHHFLNIDKRYTPRLHNCFRIVEVALLALVLAVVIMDRQSAIKLLSLSGVIAVVFLFNAALVAYRNGNQNAHYYLLSWSILLLGVLIFVAKTLGYLPDLFITEYSGQIGSAVEMILLSYALADRFNRLRMENIRVQATAQATLEHNVAARTRELSVTLQQLELANSKLERLNTLDPMTNLYNRRYFNEILEKIHREMIDDEKPLSLMMLDIDHFKHINDNQGHLKGDEVIHRVAKIIEEHCRENHCVPARFGGEEFVILMPDHLTSHTLSIAESIRLQVEEAIFQTDFSESQPPSDKQSANHKASSTFSATVSIGIATELPHTARMMSGLELVDQADQALYTAKQNGRNCCYFYEIDSRGHGIAHAA